MAKTNRKSKVKELEKIIIDCVTRKIRLEDLRKYKSDFDEDLWEVEGWCVLMRKDVFKLVRDQNIFAVFVGTYSMSSDKVRHSLKNLINSHVNELKKESKECDWGEHRKMCWLLGEMVVKCRNVIDEIGDEIFEYIVTVVEVCEEERTVWLTVKVFIAYPTSKVTCWLMQRLDWLMTQLDGEVVDWTGHRNVGELIWMMLRCAVGDEQRKYYSNVLNQEVSDRILNYMMRLIDCDKNDQMKVKAIVNLELMCVTNRMDRDCQNRLRLKLRNMAEMVDSAALLNNQQFNSLEHQVWWCARWCLDNLWGEMGREKQLPLVKLSPDRFEARSDTPYYSTVRSSFSVASDIYYYEVVLITQRWNRIGWNTRDATFGWKNKSFCRVGDDEHSIAFDVYFGRIVHNHIPHAITNLPAHQSPNVVGCLIDTHNRQFVFYLNGHKLDYQIDVCFSNSSYFASVCLDTHQQCQFNFGQSPFKYPPNDIQIKSFNEVTNGDVRKFQLIDAENTFDINWFKHPVIDNQVDLFYRDPRQHEHDDFVRQHEHHITNKQTHKIDLTQVECNRFIQSVIEVIQVELNDDKFIREIMTKQLNSLKENLKLNLFATKMFELIYPYTQLQFNHQNSAKCHNIGLILISIHNLFPKISPVFFQMSLNFLLSTKLISIETLRRNAQLVSSALAGFDSFRFNKLHKRILRKNEHFSKTIKCIVEYGQIESICHLYEPSCDTQTLEAAICAKWLYDQVFSGATDSEIQVRLATLSPTDRSTLLKLSSDRLSARSDRHWQSVRSIDHVPSEIYYFEVILLTDGLMRIGWATKRTELNESQIGKDNFSISFDGFTRAVRHQGEVYQLYDIEPWKVGDVIGCLIDKTNGKFTFSLNGQALSLPPDLHFSSLPYHAAVSLSSHQQVYFNFGQAPFKYGPQHIHYWDFHLALSYQTPIQTPKSSAKFDNARLNSSVILINSSVVGNISIKRKTHNFRTQRSNFITNKKTKIDHDESPQLKLGSIDHSTQTNSLELFESIPRPHAECRLCTEPFTSKLVRFVCCPNLILCLDCVKLHLLCPKCSKQPSNAPSIISLITPSTIRSISIINKCCLCTESSSAKLVRFICCSNLILCIDHIKIVPQCPNCSKQPSKFPSTSPTSKG